MTLSAFITTYPSHTEEAEERAAIMQYDGGMPKRIAEEEAVRWLIRKYDLRPTLLKGE